MHEFRDGEGRRKPTSPPPGPERDLASSDRLEEIGDLHYHAASYTSACDYYLSSLRALMAHQGRGTDLPAIRELHIKLSDCYRMQGLFAESASELDLALECLEPTDAIQRARIEVRLSRVRQAQGRFDEAIDLARGAFAVLSLTDRHRDVGGAQMVMGIAHACTGHVIKADEFFQDALATYRRISDPVSQAHALNNLALLAKRACRWTRALALYERADELFRHHGATYESNVLHLNKAVLYRKMGRRADAMATTLRGVKLARSRGDQADLTRLQLLLGQLHIDDRRFAEAEQALLEAKVLAERQDLRRELALVDEFLGDLMFAMRRFDEAEMNYSLAEDRARALSESNDVLAEVRRRQADLALAQGSPTRALELVASGLELAQSAGEEFERGFLHRTRGAALAEQGDRAEAIRAHEDALDAFSALRMAREKAATLLELAQLHLESELVEDAVLARGRIQEALQSDSEDGSVNPCPLQICLARAELVLGHHDEALIALFELERLTCHDDGHLDVEVEALRSDIEAGMAQQAQQAGSSLEILAELPDLELEEDDRSESLQRVLENSAERLGAERGVVAVRAGRGRLEVIATLGMPKATARELSARALALLASEDVASARVWSQADRDPAWALHRGGPRAPRSAAVAFPVRDSDEGIEGVFYFDAELRSDRSLPFDAPALALASTSVELLREALLRSVRGDSQLPAVIEHRGAAFSRIITQSPKVHEVLDLCSKVASSPFTVLFTGETGTGKGLLAELVHELSPRTARPLISVNCAAIPETLLESELFGHVRGSFTGADRDQDGLILSARGGTLFLDEVGKMPIPMQAKLLHFLDDKRVRPVGGVQSEPIDVRVLCATKRDLKQMVDREEFLEDLYYRLLDFPIEVPPLRDRGEDVLLLAEMFIERTCRELDRPTPRLTRGAANRLRGYRWPGNVRELEKSMRRGVLLAGEGDRIREAHLSADICASTVEGGSGEELHDELRPLREQIANLERHVLQASLDQVGWNRAEAARQLKISYPTLLQKIRLYKLTPTC